MFANKYKKYLFILLAAILSIFLLFWLFSSAKRDTCISSDTVECVYVRVDAKAVIVSVDYIDGEFHRNQAFVRPPWDVIIPVTRGRKAYVSVFLFGSGDYVRCDLRLGSANGKVLATNTGVVGAICEAWLP
jgi:hypothetical protein